jgi:hypothetical protein
VISLIYKTLSLIQGKYLSKFPTKFKSHSRINFETPQDFSMGEKSLLSKGSLFRNVSNHSKLLIVGN